MSDQANKMPLALAYSLASALATDLAPACERIEIAGSIRREKPLVGDIEIVAIPRVETMGADLLGEGMEWRPLDVKLGGMIGSEVLKVVKGFKVGAPWKYAQFEIAGRGCKLDLFLATKETWGCVFTIRTGPAEFSHRLVTTRSQGGLCPAHLRFREGRLVSAYAGGPLDTPEEADVFKALSLHWIEPEERT